jgi:hypothetical protein
MDWTQLISITSVIVTNLVTIITLYVHLDNKTENRLAKMQDMMNQWQQRSENVVYQIQLEMKDFHGRLCSIEERSKKAQ